MLQITSALPASLHISTIVEVLMFLLAVGGIFFKIAQNDSNTKIKINENTTKIIALEQELIKMKRESDTKFSDIEGKSTAALENFKKENREDHGKIFDQLGEAITKLTEVSSQFKMHMNESYKSPRDIQQ